MSGRSCVIYRLQFNSMSGGSEGFSTDIDAREVCHIATGLQVPCKCNAAIQAAHNNSASAIQFRQHKAVELHRSAAGCLIQVLNMYNARRSSVWQCMTAAVGCSLQVLQAACNARGGKAKQCRTRNAAVGCFLQVLQASAMQGEAEQGLLLSGDLPIFLPSRPISHFLNTKRHLSLSFGHHCHCQYIRHQSSRITRWTSQMTRTLRRGVFDKSCSVSAESQNALLLLLLW